MSTKTEPVVTETHSERHVVGSVQDYTLQTRHEIPKQWAAFFNSKFEVPNAKPGAMFGVSFMADGEGAFRYAVGCEVDEVAKELPPGTCEVILSAGEYAILRAFGPVADLPEQFDKLFSQWIPQSDFEPREGAVFEVYPDDPRNGPDGMAYEIWAPVRAR